MTPDEFTFRVGFLVRFTAGQNRWGVGFWMQALAFQLMEIEP